MISTRFKLSAGILLILVFLNNTAFADFQVKVYSSANDVENLATADGLINGIIPNNGFATEFSPVIDYFDDSGGNGNHPNDFPFPGGYLDNFALIATCELEIVTPGIYDFRTNNDDGARLIIDDTVVILDDTQHAPADFFGSINLTAGKHDLELVFFEFSFGGSIELSAINFPVNNTYQLIGDTENNGLACNYDLIFGNGFE